MIHKTINDEAIQIVDWTKSNAIISGKGETNAMRVVCSGNQLKLWVNDILLSDITDDSLSGGSFALQAGRSDLDEKSIKVAFGNLIVRNPYQKISQDSEKVIFADKFDDNQNQWDLYEESGASAIIEDGQLVMQVLKNELFWTKPRKDFSDVDVTFDATVLEGADASAAYGVICRNQDKINYYVFIVAADGQYGLYKSFKGDMQEIVGFKNSQSIRTGKASNNVHVICSGDDLQLSVNDESLIQVKDDTYKEGTFMLAAQSFDQEGKPISIAFDNLEIK